MAEPDFRGLRADIENVTRLPEFATVERRARWHRLRDRASVAGAMLVTSAVLAPVVVVALAARPASVLLRPDPPVVAVASPSPSAAASPAVPTSARIRAAAAIDLDHLYVAVDACSGGVCSLQVAPVTLTGASPPIVVGLLRDRASDPVSDVQLVPLTAASLLLSGVVANDRRYTRVSVAGGAVAVNVPGAATHLTAGDRAVQFGAGDAVYALRRGSEAVTPIAAQPPVGKPELAAGVAPNRGWWVVGGEPVDGTVQVSVSRNQGGAWLTRTVGMSAVDAPVLASVDGQTAYLVARTASGGSVARTVDGGQTWQLVSDKLSWPGRAPNGRLGAVARPDGSLLTWLAAGSVPIYQESTDGGRTFHEGSGPGAIVADPTGYVVVAQPMWVSPDARSWSVLPPAAYLPPRS
ncbi:MAG: hypothetical protein QOE03_1983 [Micromonosporaceae bacterium]|nr:hypothetical protein [Micromonosporaceae bacterium]